MNIFKNAPLPLKLVLLVVPIVGIYISLHAHAATCALPTDKGTASTTFSVPTSGAYRLWAHILAPSSSSNTFELDFDNDCPSISVGGGTVTAGAFNWSGYTAGTVNPIIVNLASGAHTLTIAGQAASVGVDRIMLTANTACVPTGNGTNCQQGQVSTGSSNSPVPSNVYVNANSDTNTNATSALLKPLVLKPSVIQAAKNAASIAALAALLCLAFLYVMWRVRLRKASGQIQTAGNPSLATETSSGGNLDTLRYGWRKSLVIAIAFGVICGLLVAAVALAAQSDTIMIDLSGAKVSGGAQLVANANAINGHMVQFGVGATAFQSATPAPTATPKATPKPTATPATPTPTPVSSNCTNPSWSSSDPQGTDPLGTDGVWWINNDAWSGSHGPQTLYVCNQSSWYAVSNQPNNGGAVETYPDSEYDVAGRGNATKTIAQYNSITSTFSENFPAAGSWDAAYDLWLNNWSTEIMIWNQWTGTQLYWPNNKSVTVMLGGVPYWFQNNGGELMFFRQTMAQSGSVDILSALKYLQSQGLVKSTDVPTQLEYGVEICSTSGTETFPMTGLTFTSN
ncbi:MAG TPA: hypothetical protein VGH44_02035 [Candidatus Saccharimonadia bacterium]|jgi:hypothetical protein